MRCLCVHALPVCECVACVCMRCLCVHALPVCAYRDISCLCAHADIRCLCVHMLTWVASAAYFACVCLCVPRCLSSRKAYTRGCRGTERQTPTQAGTWCSGAYSRSCAIACSGGSRWCCQSWSTPGPAPRCSLAAMWPPLLWFPPASIIALACPPWLAGLGTWLLVQA